MSRSPLFDRFARVVRSSELSAEEGLTAEEGVRRFVARGAARRSRRDFLAGEAEKFLADAERVLPGVSAAAKRSAGKVVAHLAHWPSNPLTRGSYTSYAVGQFTTLAGNEGKRVGHLHFAGEHANSFYVWQGFMEGAALSGIDAANEILGDLKTGAL